MLDTISYFPLFHVRKEVKVEGNGEAEKGTFDDEMAGEVKLDEVVGGEGGCGEGSNENLDSHHDEEENADGELRPRNSRVLVVDVLGSICIAYVLDGVQREVYHGCD